MIFGQERKSSENWKSTVRISKFIIVMTRLVDSLTYFQLWFNKISPKWLTIWWPIYVLFILLLQTKRIYIGLRFIDFGMEEVILREANGMKMFCLKLWIVRKVEKVARRMQLMILLIVSCSKFVSSKFSDRIQRLKKFKTKFVKSNASQNATYF